MYREGIPVMGNMTGKEMLTSFILGMLWEILQSVTSGTGVWRLGGRPVGFMVDKSWNNVSHFAVVSHRRPELSMKKFIGTYSEDVRKYNMFQCIVYCSK